MNGFVNGTRGSRGKRRGSSRSCGGAATPYVHQGVSPVSTFPFQGMPTLQQSQGVGPAWQNQTIASSGQCTGVTPIAPYQGFPTLEQSQGVGPAWQNQTIAPSSQCTGVSPIVPYQGFPTLEQSQGIGPAWQNQTIAPFSQFPTNSLGLYPMEQCQGVGPAWQCQGIEPINQFPIGGGPGTCGSPTSPIMPVMEQSQGVGPAWQNQTITPSGPVGGVSPMGQFPPFPMAGRYCTSTCCEASPNRTFSTSTTSWEFTNL